MKLFIRNYSEYKKLLNKVTDKINPADFPVFCMTIGYLFNQIQDFDLLYSTLQTALNMVDTDRFSQSDYHQWLLFLNDNPHRFHECVNFINNIKQDDTIDVIDEIQILYSSNHYSKQPLKAQNRYNSVDTVVMDNNLYNQNPEKQVYEEQEKLQRRYSDFQGEKVQQKNRHSDHQNQNSYDNSPDFDMIKKMQQDEEFARKLQEEQQQIMKDYRSKMKQDETLCEICYVDLYEGDPCFLDNCGHGFHKDCVKEGFKINISTNTFPLKCPNAECSVECLESDIKQILPDEMYKKYQEHTLKAYAQQNGESVSWCPTPSCGWMFFFQKGDQPRFQCPECKKQYCLNCRCQWHKDMTCAEYKISNTVSEDDKKFLDFAAGHKFKQCPKCKFWVEKTEGCDHMRCKCKFEFCYKCGGVYMKCECHAKARENHERMMAARAEAMQQARRRKQEKAREKAQKAAKKAAEKAEKQANKRAKSKKK